MFDTGGRAATTTFVEREIGDVLFNGSVGRTDLPGGNHRQLIDSIGREVLTLPDDYRLFPGHGPATTVAAERRGNPFLV